jgi:2-succinyl-5-enolpyruvyl-6-hydroxy-3-cyclohexene-1-carboxylate synthase
VDRADVSLACAAALVDALVAGGVRHACVSPGSRSTALALALARNDRVTVHVHLDERSSGFFALGLAKATGKPVAVACTSGTAAAELLAPIVEASQSRVPLVVLTADRPPRLRGTGANQTIDQTELFGRHVRAFVEPPVPSVPGDADAWAEAGVEALHAMAGLPIGPAHVNCPFEESLVPGEASTGRRTVEVPRRDPKPWERLATTEDVDRVAAAASGARGVIVAGWSAWDDLGAIDLLADHLEWPLLAEPGSGLRTPGEGVRGPDGALAAGQGLLGTDRWLDAHRPEVAIQVGAAPTARATQRLVASVERLVVIDVHHLEPDPEHRADVRVRAMPEEVAAGLLGRPTGDALAITSPTPVPSAEELRAARIEPAPFGWRADWLDADERARGALDRVLDDEDRPSELRVARDLAAWVPDGGLLFVGNSGPVRDLDLAMAPRSGLRVLGNRGASGIDGLVSTALGVAAARRGPTVALLGDLSFLVDAGALLWLAGRGIDAVLVVLNNGGGQVFSRLDQGALPERQELFVTPHGFEDLGALCVTARAGHARVEQMRALVRSLEDGLARGGVQVVEVTIDPGHDRAIRQGCSEAIREALIGA